MPMPRYGFLVLLLAATSVEAAAKLLEGKKDDARRVALINKARGK